MDRVSELPPFIIHEILSFLSTKEAARTMILSKTWQHSWSSFPVLDFNLMHCKERDQKMSKECMDKHYESIDKVLERYKNENIRIQKFRFYGNIYKPRAYLVDKWIQIALQNGAKQLDLWGELLGRSDSLSDILPETDISAKSLIELKVYWCGLKVLNIDCPYLKKLQLRAVYLNDETLQNLIYACPLIEDLVLRFCAGLKKIEVRNLHSLKTLEVWMTRGKKLDIEAPTLHSLALNYFRLLGSNHNHQDYLQNFFIYPPSENLLHLHLSWIKIREEGFQNLISKFPNLRHLSLEYIQGMRKIEVLNHSLEKLSVISSFNSLDFNINSTNLISFEYNGLTVPSLSFASAIDQFNFSLRGFCGGANSWLLKLRDFLSKISLSELCFFIKYRLRRFDINSLMEISVPQTPKVEKLKLRLGAAIVQALEEPKAEIVCAELLEGLFWSCHPRTLTMIWGEDVTNDMMIKFLYEKTKSRRSQNFHWQHDLKGATVEIHDNARHGWSTLGCNSSADFFQTLGLGQAVRFTFSW